MNVCVVGGAGYVGLITGLGLSETGHRVLNVDVDQGRILRLQAGDPPFHEEGVELLLKRNLDAGRLTFSTDLGTAVAASDVVFIAVGTPSQEDGKADLSQVIQVAEELVHHIEGYKLIVIKSTVPVSTVELVLSILSGQKVEGEHFDVVANPEFLREGKGLHDFFYPDRIVIGASSDKARDIIRALYAPIVLGEVSWPEGGPRPDTPGNVPIVETDLASAQIIKYASNAFLAARISFINEIAGICEEVGADITEVTHGISYDPRIGHRYLDAGLGFGGPCLEKDLSALINIAEGRGYDPHVLRAVLERNGRQMGRVVAKLKQLVGNLIYRKTIAVLGLSFKPGTNDVRNCLALKVIDQLEREGAVVRAYDPVAMPEVRVHKPHVVYCKDPYEAVLHADGMMILTEWPCFRDLDYQEIKDRMASPCIVDGRNLLSPEPLRAMGFNYVGIGRR